MPRKKSQSLFFCDALKKVPPPSPTTTTRTHKNAKKNPKVISVNLALDLIKETSFLTKGAQIHGNSIELRNIVIKIWFNKKNFLVCLQEMQWLN